MQSKSFNTFRWASLAVAMVYSCLVSVQAQDHITLIDGWTEVNQYWPMQQDEFFIANSKGYYNVEVKLPESDIHDFVVEFRYFYNYDKMRPTILVVACGGEAVEIRADLDQDDRNKWVSHETVISKLGCANEPSLSYSILLHEPRSVFAWKYLKVSQDASPNEADSLNDAQQVTPPYPSVTTIQDHNTEQPRTTPIDQESGAPQTAANTDTPSTIQEATTQPTTNNPNVVRQMSTKKILMCRAKSCDRTVFDYSRFRPLINGLPGEVTQAELAGDTRLHISTVDNNLLNLVVRSDSLASLSEVDLCVDFQLYMETNTLMDFELWLGSENFRLLESIKRLNTDTTANKWDRFKRCLSEYMPKLPAQLASITDSLKLRLVPRDLNNGRRLIAVKVDVKTVSFIRKAYPVLEFLPDLATFTEAKCLEKYWVLDKDGLIKPEVQLMQRGKTKKLIISQIDANQNSFDLTSRWLKVDSIQLHDNRFLFTYRIQRADWIKSLDFEFQSSATEGNVWLSQNLYQAPAEQQHINDAEQQSDKADKDKEDKEQGSVRRKRETVDQSVATVDYPLPISAIKLKGLTTDEFRIRLRHYIKPNTVADNTMATHGQHHSTQKELVVDSIAFGDVCALGPYCKNNGTCKPTGLVSVECTCLDGFSGDHCEKVNPCEAYYGDKRGSELCEDIGSRCEPSLPVFRCLWPNDEYLACKVLHQADSHGQDGSVAGDGQKSDPLTEGEAKWKEKADSESRLVVILSVFMIAMLLFAVVIVGNLIGRLRKTKDNLRNSQLEMHQISKRATTVNNQPTASTSANAPPTRFVTSGGIRRPSSGAPAASGGPLSYSNRSFDSS